MKFEKVKAGDNVILNRSGEAIGQIVVAVRVTPSQIVIAGVTTGTERKFWRKNGEEVGTAGHVGYRWVQLDEATEEAIAKIEAAELRRDTLAALRGFDLNRIPTRVIQEAVAVLVAYNKGRTGV